MGERVGLRVGDFVGDAVGEMVGLTVGDFVGASVEFTGGADRSTRAIIKARSGRGRGILYFAVCWEP